MEFILDDVLPLVNMVIAVDATYRNLIDLRFIKNRIYRSIILLTAIGTLLLGLLYLLVLLSEDHVIDPDPSRFSALYVRPLLTYIIVLLNITSRNRRLERLERRETTREVQDDHNTDPR